MNDSIISTYSGPQNGGELPYFIGKQYGSGWLRTIGRFAIPILKRLGGVAYRTVKDVFNKNKDVLPALKENVMNEVADFTKDPKRSKSPKGGSINKRRKTIFHK